jgi:hypothetical protein
VEAVNVSACSAEITTYAYDGERYVELDTRSENLCEAECPTDAEIIETARQQLVRDEPDFYSLDGFREESASVESMDDLNGDGTADFLVAPGLSYSGPNVELAIYLSDADGCAGSYAGHFGASDVSASDGTTNGVRDVKATNVSACSAETTTYAYDGELYQPGSTQSEPLCDN